MRRFGDRRPSASALALPKSTSFKCVTPNASHSPMDRLGRERTLHPYQSANLVPPLQESLSVHFIRPPADALTRYAHYATTESSRLTALVDEVLVRAVVVAAWRHIQRAIC